MLEGLVGQLGAEIPAPGVRGAEVRRVEEGGLGGWILRAGREGHRANPTGQT